MEIAEIKKSLYRIEQLTMIAAKEVLNLEEAALYTSFSKAFLRREKDAGKIRASKVGRKVFFQKSDLNEWLSRGTQKTNQEIEDDAAQYLITNKNKQRYVHK